MNQPVFLQTINEKARHLKLNPLLLLSGLEGLHTFKDVPLNQINYSFLDSLILTIFTLRIGDGFRNIAEENSVTENAKLRAAAIHELTELDAVTIASSSSPYLQSFAKMAGGKSTIRRYHEKALEVAAIEIKRTQLIYNNESIGTIILALCQTELKETIESVSFFKS
ncbi:MAG: hypothetical protein V4676_13475 [Bacteroidota bacterium]